MNIFQKVNVYKKIIQDYITTHPQSEYEDVLRHLLLRHYPLNQETQTLRWTLSASRIKTNPLPKMLVKEMKHKPRDKDIIDVIDPYLKNNPLDKHDEIFALLQAYFYYFEDLYSNKELQERPALYQQIFVPLHLYRQNMEKDLVDDALAKADANKARIACEILRSITIPNEKLPIVVSKLLENLDADEEDTRIAACQALANMPIPEVQQEKIVIKLLEKTRRSLLGLRASETLAKLTIPKNLREQAVDTLLKFIFTQHTFSYDYNSIILNIAAIEGQLERVVAYALERADDHDDWVRDRAVYMLGILAKMSITAGALREKITDKLLEKTEDQELFFEAFVRLEEMSIPESRQEKVVNTLLERTDSKNLICSNEACAALGKVSIPKQQYESVINKFKEKLYDPHNWGVVDSLGNVKTSEKLRDEFFNKIFEKVDDNDNLIIESAFRTLFRMASTKEEYERVTTKLIEKLDSGIYQIEIFVCEALKGADIPEIECSRIIAKLLAKIPNRNSDTNESLCEVLTEMIIPKDLQQQTVTKLLGLATSTLFHGNVNRYACKALGKVPIPEAQRETVITTLITVIENAKGFAEWAACIALAKIKVSNTEYLEIFSKLVEIGLKQDKLVKELGEILPQTLLALYEKLSLGQRTKIVIQLESRQQDVANNDPNQLPFLLSLIQKCQSRNAFDAALRSYLPPERVEDVKKVLR